MKKGKPKTPYVLFGVGVLYNTFAMVLAITLYLAMQEYAVTFTRNLLLLLFPIIAAIIVFFDLLFKFRSIKAYRRAK